MSTLSRRCAGLLIGGFPGTSAPAEFLRAIDEGLGGAILFGRNVDSASQVATLVRSLKQHASRPFIAAVDQEGGRVARLTGDPFTPLPAMRAVGACGDIALAHAVGELLGRECRATGFDLDFAPVLDVDTNPNNPIIGARSLHGSAAVVAELGTALAQGIEAAGVASCAKHFPGHGDTALDSHTTLPTLLHARERLESLELLPFAAYARAELASVMTAHITFPELDPRFPATMSSAILQQLLRGQLGFAGLIVSDDLEMKAISDHFGVEAAAVEGLAAGVDLFLVCKLPEARGLALEALVHGAEKSAVLRTRIEDAERRIARFGFKFVRGPEDGISTLESAEHRALARQITKALVA